MKRLALALVLLAVTPAYAFNLPFRPGTATAVSGAATLNQDAGTITTDSLVTAAAASYTLTIGCNAVNPNSIVQASLANGTNTTGVPVITRVQPGNGVVTVTVTNLAASAALNGTLLVAFIVFN